MNNRESNKEKLQQFIREQGYDPVYWFVEFVNETSQQMRIRDIIDKKEYLAGKHKVTERPAEMFAGKLIEPRRVVLQYARKFINYSTSYLIGKGFTYSGDQELVKEINKLYKRVFNGIDYDIVKSVYSYGNGWEHVYRTSNDVKSRLIDAADSYPVIDNTGEYISFIENYTVGNVTYWNVYVDDEVHKFNNNGGDIQQIGTYMNLGGLPINYRNDNPIDDIFGRADLDDYISLLDSIEDLISKGLDAHYRHINGLGVLSGQFLTNFELPVNVTGGGIVIDSDSKFEYVNNPFDSQAFNTLYNQLMLSLLDNSGIPSVSYGRQDVSNLSEVSLKLLFTVAIQKAEITERYIKEGLYQRLDKLKVLLEAQGKYYSNEAWDSITVTMHYNTPSSDTETIGNLKTLRDMGAISIESIMKHSRYTEDVSSEIELMENEKRNQTSTDTSQS